MFDAILKSKFYIRSKSEIKTTMKRIEIIKRKRMAMERFLRIDVVDLLKNDLNSNAYGRVEQLYADQKLTSCYEFVEQSCLLILSHLSAMDKNRECLEECKEAISTLMFAAARFADLPELRELRSLFAERYGNYLEPYVNQEFVKNLKADPPSKEIKIQMIQEIAMECGIQWDSKALEQDLYKQPPFLKDTSRYAKERNNESSKPHHLNGLETGAQETEKNYNNKQTEIVKKEYAFGNGVPYKPRSQVEKKEEKHKDQTIGNGLPFKSRAEVEKKEEKHGHGRVSPYWSSNSSSSSESTASPEYSTDPDDNASEDIIERKLFGFRSMVPPYVKPNSSIKVTNWETSSGPGKKEEIVRSECKDDNRRNSSKDTPEGRKLYGLRSMAPPYIITDSTRKYKDNSLQREEESANSSKPVPRSMRIRRPLKPVPGSQENNEVSKSNPIVDHKDEEEKKAEKLLSHAPARTGSLPAECLSAKEGRRGIERAATISSGVSPRGHVHPKLPDYDDFVARLAALRANS